MFRRNLPAHLPNITDTDERTKDLAISYPRTHTPLTAPRPRRCAWASLSKMPIPFACDNVPVIKRTRNARVAVAPRHRHRDNVKTHGDKWSVGVSIPYGVVSCDGEVHSACCCVANSGMMALRTFRSALRRLYVMSHRSTGPS